MTEIFSTVLNMSLTASVVIGVVLLLRLLLKEASKACSYALWSVVLFRLLCPVSVESGLSILPDGLGYRPGEQAMEIYEAMEPGELPTAAYHAVGDVLNGGLGTVTVKVEPGHGAGEGSGYGSLMHPEVWFLVFARLWPTGAALLAGYSLWSLFCLRRRLSAAVLLRDNLYRAEGIGTPFVLGVVRPKIYLPAGILEAEMPYIIPTVVTLTENPDGSWSVLNYWEPRDGSYYVEDIRGIFPGAAAEEALHSQKYIIAQVQDCYSQAVEYAKTDSDVNMNVDAVIEGLFDEICADPLPSSNAYSYLEAHPIEYRELLYYGEYTRDYCERYLYGLGMEDGGPAEFGLREAIREVVLKELNS